jgi:DNA-binding transcriptional ArsR family regulator
MPSGNSCSEEPERAEPSRQSPASAGSEVPEVPEVPGSAGYGPKRVTDPRAIRALAHPVRMALLELLAHAGTLTATQASEALGESPANCAFHLRTLAKYGFVEEAGGGRGRVRPWRRTHSALDFPDPGDDPRLAGPAEELSGLLADAVLNRAGQALARRASWPADWQRALPQAEHLSYLTPAEARRLAADLAEVLARHDDRIDHPERRPPGAMPVEILLVSYPLTHLLSVPTHPSARPDLPEEKS